MCTKMLLQTPILYLFLFFPCYLSETLIPTTQAHSQSTRQPTKALSAPLSTSELPWTEANKPRSGELSSISPLSTEVDTTPISQISNRTLEHDIGSTAHSTSMPDPIESTLFPSNVANSSTEEPDACTELPPITNPLSTGETCQHVHSCKGRCGEYNSLSGASSSFEKPECSCDSRCIEVDDCCWDFLHECPQLNKSRSHYPELVLDCSEEGYLTVHSCPSTWPNGTVRSKCLRQINSIQHIEDIVIKTPVTDNATGTEYANTFCAECNGVNQKHLEFWQVRVLSYEPNVPNNITLYDMEREMHKLHFSFRKYSKSYWPSRRCYNIIDDCMLRLIPCQLYRTACSKYLAPVSMYSQLSFRNTYCALCSGITTLDLKLQSECGVIGALGHPPGDGDFTFSSILSFGNDGSIYVESQETRQVHVELYKFTLEFVILGTGFLINQTVNSSQLWDTVENDIKFFAEENSHRSESLYADISYNDSINLHWSVAVSKNISCRYLLNTPDALWNVLLAKRYNITIKTDILVSELQLSSFTLYDFRRDHEHHTIFLSEVYTTPDSYIPCGSNLTVSNCNLSAIDASTFSLHNSSVHFKIGNTNFSIPVSDATITNNTLLLCSDLLDKLLEAHNIFQEDSTHLSTCPPDVEYILSIVLLSASAILLVIAIGCKAVDVSENVMNVQQLILMSVMLLFDILFCCGTIMHNESSSTLGSRLFGYLSYWTRLAVFFTYNAFAVKLFQVLGMSFTRARKSFQQEIVLFLLHSLLAPTCFLALAIVLDFGFPDTIITPLIGQARPWIIGRLAPLLFFFIVPSGLLVLINLSLIVATTCKICRSMNARTKTLHKKRSLKGEVKIYGSLFLLSGIIWLLMALQLSVRSECAMNIIFTVLLGGEGAWLAIMSLTHTLTARRRSQLRTSSRAGATKATDHSHITNTGEITRL